jgi:hypothetical protein
MSAASDTLVGRHSACRPGSPHSTHARPTRAIRMPVPTTPNPEPGPPPAPGPEPDPFRKPVEDPPEIQPPAPVREPPVAPPSLAWMAPALRSPKEPFGACYPKVGPSTSSRRSRSASSGFTRWASKPDCSARLMSVPCP